jgi:hypothetical protein
MYHKSTGLFILIVSIFLFFTGQAFAFMESQSRERFIEKDKIKDRFELAQNNSLKEELPENKIYNFNEGFTIEDIDKTLKDNRESNSDILNRTTLFNTDYTVAGDTEIKPEEEKKDEDAATEAEEELKEGENTGQDPTKPLTRLDIRLKYQKLLDDRNNWMATLRVDKPVPLENKWTVSLRFDMPFIWSNLPNPYKNYSNPEGNYNFGSSEFLAQVLFIAPPKGRSAFGFGFQTIFPTASDDQFGRGKYVIAPVAAGLYYPSSLPKGSFAGIMLRNEFSYAGDDYRSDINQLVMQPLFNVNLPDRWFFTIYPEIRLDWDTGRWFVPFDIMAGKLVTPTTVMSLEYKAGLVKDLPLYDYELEFRTGFFF